MIILGFGSIEDSLEEDILSRLRRGESGEDISKHSHEIADVNDKMNRTSAPERYSRVWVHVPMDGQIGVHFLHINRRHPFAPDGWASLSTEYSIKETEIEKRVFQVKCEYCGNMGPPDKLCNCDFVRKHGVSIKHSVLKLKTTNGKTNSNDTHLKKNKEDNHD